MKKLNQPRDKKFKFVRLYLTELDKLWKLLEENCKSMEVIADQYKIEEFDELFGESGQTPQQKMLFETKEDGEIVLMILAIKSIFLQEENHWQVIIKT